MGRSQDDEPRQTYDHATALADIQKITDPAHRVREASRFIEEVQDRIGAVGRIRAAAITEQLAQGLTRAEIAKTATMTRGRIYQIVPPGASSYPQRSRAAKSSPGVSVRTALYRIFGDADLLLYIGISKNFGTRWKEHARVQPWWDEHRRMTVDWRDSRPEALAAEIAAIKAEHPKYNKRGAASGGHATRPVS